MKATVFYIHLTQLHRDTLNSHPHGWSSDIGVAYMNAREGKIDGSNFDLFVKAAMLEAEDAETIWTLLQNVNVGWVDKPAIECHTDFPRSMDLGDIIVWEDGRRERCAAMGFEAIEIGGAS